MILRSEVDFLIILASAASLVGSFFLVKSILLSGPKQIAAMSGTYIGSNPHLESALAEQKTDSIVGFSMTFLSGIFWIFTAFASFNLNFTGAVFASVMSIISLVFIGHKIARYTFDRMILRVRAISFSAHVESYLKDYSIQSFNAIKLLEDAMRFELGTLIDQKIDAYDNLAKILTYAGAAPGANHILELKNKDIK